MIRFRQARSVPRTPLGSFMVTKLATSPVTGTTLLDSSRSSVTSDKRLRAPVLAETSRFGNVYWLGNANVGPDSADANSD